MRENRREPSKEIIIIIKSSGATSQGALSCVFEREYGQPTNCTPWGPHVTTGHRLWFFASIIRSYRRYLMQLLDKNFRRWKNKILLFYIFTVIRFWSNDYGTVVYFILLCQVISALLCILSNFRMWTSVVLTSFFSHGYGPVLFFKYQAAALWIATCNDPMEVGS